MWRSPITYFLRRNALTDVNDPYTKLCKELNLHEFLKSGDRAQVFFSGAVWQLAGSAWPSLSDDDALRLAKENLASCEYVGIYEHLMGSLDPPSYTFQWPQVDEFPQENVTKDRIRVADLDRSTVTRIRELSRLDAELYDYGPTTSSNARMSGRSCVSAAGSIRSARSFMASM
jgi:hypothetical protein